MKLHIPEIVWHEIGPIYSLDFQNKNDTAALKTQRFATCGRNTTIHIWNLSVDSERGSLNVDFLSALARHVRPVNIVRFSPAGGELLASGSDDSTVMIWRLQQGPSSVPSLDEDTATCASDVSDVRDRETWQPVRVLRGHLEDVYDLCWYLRPAPPAASSSSTVTSQFLASSAIDGSVIEWEVLATPNEVLARNVCLHREHKHYVQGVAVDPAGQTLASIANDRYLRIYKAQQTQTVYAVHSAPYLTIGDRAKDPKAPKNFKLFHDETWKSFFRRLAFSPDGNFLVVPSGVLPAQCAPPELFQTLQTLSPSESASEKPPAPKPANKVQTAAEGDHEAQAKAEPLEMHVCYVFSRPQGFARPAFYLPTDSLRRPAIAVRFCPTLFRHFNYLADQKSPSWGIRLPYRMLCAVATDQSLLLFDTSSTRPVAFASQLHYSSINDIAWSADGRTLALCSSDGYCSFLVFSGAELTEPWTSASADSSRPQLLQPQPESLVPLVSVLPSPSSSLPSPPPNTAVQVTESSMSIPTDPHDASMVTPSECHPTGDHNLESHSEPESAINAVTPMQTIPIDAAAEVLSTATATPSQLETESSIAPTEPNSELLFGSSLTAELAAPPQMMDISHDESPLVTTCASVVANMDKPTASGAAESTVTQTGKKADGDQDPEASDSFEPPAPKKRRIAVVTLWTNCASPNSS